MSSEEEIASKFAKGLLLGLLMILVGFVIFPTASQRGPDIILPGALGIIFIGSGMLAILRAAIDGILDLLRSGGTSGLDIVREQQAHGDAAPATLQDIHSALIGQPHAPPRFRD